MAQGGVVIAESAEVTSAYEEVRADGNETNWFVCLFVCLLLFPTSYHVCLGSV